MPVKGKLLKSDNNYGLLIPMYKPWEILSFKRRFCLPNFKSYFAEADRNS